MIKDCLSAAGITAIVWIDDFFASPARDVLADAVHKHAERLKEKGSRKIDVPAFAKVDLTKSKNEIDDAIDEALEDMSDPQVAEAEKALAASSGTPVVDDTPQPDLPQADFHALQKAFGKHLQTFSLGAWTSSGITQFAAAGANTLFLVDKEFNREPGGIDGTKVLADIVNTTAAFCVMLTHTCTEADQEDRRVSIATTEGLLPHRFCVLSKQQSGSGAIEPRFERAIYTVMTHRFTGEIANALRSAITSSADQTTLELTKQSVFDLDLALFENSHREGVPEFDVVRRIFNIEERYSINQTLQNPEVQNQLRAARAFRQKTGALRASWLAPRADMSAFREWRKREVYEEGLGLNVLHASLSCGDIFETQAEAKDRYIFLAQPCDLMIRDNGRRRAEVGLLVLVIEAPSSAIADAGSSNRFFDIKGVFGPDKSWRVDFQSHIVADLDVLDLAVFNQDGVVQLRNDHPAPGIALPQGWQRRMNRIKPRFFKNASPVPPPPLGLGTDAAALFARIDDDWVHYPLRRIGRLESETAKAILAAWATFHTRAALEHDFAYIKVDLSGVKREPGGPTTPAPISAPATALPPGAAKAEARAQIARQPTPPPEGKSPTPSASRAPATVGQKKTEESVPAPEPEVEAQEKEEPPKG
jgi:hypothetical protein